MKKSAPAGGGQKVSTKDAILRAALELFAARGVSGTGVDDIATRAGIAKGSIYYNFGSKEGLVGELMTVHAERLAQSLAAAGQVSGAAGRRAILDTVLAEVSEHPDVAQLMVSEVFRTDRSWIEVVTQWRTVMTGPLEENLVAEFGEQHRVRCQLQAAALIGAALTTGLSWLVSHPQLPREQVLDALVEMPALRPEPR